MRESDSSASAHVTQIDYLKEYVRGLHTRCTLARSKASEQRLDSYYNTDQKSDDKKDEELLSHI